MSNLQELHELCLANDITISVAESCTSGSIASSLSKLSGSSKYFKGGIIAYNNDIKMDILDVSEEIIVSYGEVSAEVVNLMANNILSKFNSNFSIATTGFAGPVGGTKDNPIGTVFIAVSNIYSTIVRRFFFEGDRSKIIVMAVESALSLLLVEIKKYK